MSPIRGKKGKIFTYEEANSLLPCLRPLLARLAEERGRQRTMQEEIRRAADRASLGGGSRAGADYVASLTRMNACLQEVMALGVELKDQDKGLCDFPCLREGRRVYLCWHPEEDSIRYWHELDGGFIGRQPL